MSDGPTIRRGRSESVVGTPWPFIHAVEAKFGPLTIDLAAIYGNKKAPRYISPETDSLSVDWIDHIAAGRAWLNPPFSHIAPWARKCAATATDPTFTGEILLLVPHGQQDWYWEYVHPFADVYGPGRIKFVGAKDDYPKDLSLCHYHAKSPVTQVLQRWKWKEDA